MKKQSLIVIFSAAFLLLQSSLCAQDSTKTGAAKQISNSSEQADKLSGKKIQQKNLSAGHFERLDTIDVNKPKKKIKSKPGRKKQ
jgi:hypothetical protein